MIARMITRFGGAGGRPSVNGSRNGAGRRRFDHAFTLTFYAHCLFAVGCGSGFSGRRRDDTDTPAPDRDTLPAEVVDVVPPEYDDCDIVSTTLDKRSNLWDFRVKARQGVNNNLTFEWEFGDGLVYTGIDQNYTFPSSGNQSVTVTAREVNGQVAFVHTLQVEIVAGNQPPVSDAGAAQAANENQLVFLYGGGSLDPDDSNLSFRWSQLFGPPVHLLDEVTVAVAAPDAQSHDLDTDGDGTADCVDTYPGDSDGDGTLDCTERCPPGSGSDDDDGDGAAEVDSDGNGTVDCEDDCSADLDKLEPEAGSRHMRDDRRCADLRLQRRGIEMNLTSFVALVGIAIGTALLYLGRKPEAPRELRWSGMFVLVASFSVLLGIEMPDVLNWIGSSEQAIAVGE